MIHRIELDLNWCQEAAVASVLHLWQEIGPAGYGEFDPCEYAARINGWLPLEVGKKMEVGFLGRRYEIRRLDDLCENDYETPVNAGT